MNKIYTLVGGLLLSLASFSQVTVDVGAGTTVGQSIPVEPYYGYTYSQSIFLSGEVGSGTISELSYFSNDNGIASTNQWKIYMGTTNKDEFDNATDWIALGDLTEVYDGAITVDAGGIVTVILGTPFAYNGNQNLVIAVEDNQGGYDSSDDDFLCTGTTGNRSITYRNDSTDPDPASPPVATYLKQFVPNIRVVRTGCELTTSVTESNVTAIAADVTWSATADAVSYDVEWGTQGFIAGSGTSTGSTNVLAGTNMFAITGLSPETFYSIYVRVNCASGAGVWQMIDDSFQTAALCPVPDNVSLDAVAATNAAISWTTGTGTETLWDVEYGAQNYVLGTGTMLNVLNGTPDTTFNPLVQNTSYDYYVRANCPANNAVSFWVGPLSLTTLYSCPLPTNQSITTTEFGATLDWDPVGIEGSWNLNIVPQGNAQGDASVMMATITTAHDTTFTAGLESNTAYSYYVQADCGSGDESVWAGPFDFTTTEYCFEPTALTHTNTTTTSVDLSWTMGAFGETAWNVKWGVDGFDPATEGTDLSGLGASTTSLTGLTPGTDYSFYVEAICDLTAPNDTTSVWVGPYDFSTSIACLAPVGLNAINVSTTHANLIFQAGGTESSWDIEWGTAGFTVDNSEELGSEALTTTQYLATGLSTCGDYEFYVRANCGGVDGSSTWTGPYAFSTLTGTVMAPYTQNFDAPNLPNCWSNPGGDWRILESEDGAGTAGISGAATISGTGNYLFADSWDTRDQEVITPSIDFSGLANTAHVGFWALMNNTTDGVKNSVSVEAFDGDDWVLLGEYSANNADWVKVDYALPASFPVTTAQFRLVFNRIGGDNDDIFIDDFYVVDGETCVNEAGTAVAGVICTTENNIDLFDAIEGNSTNNGTWYYPNQANSLFSTTSGFVTGLTEGVDYTFEYVTTGCGTTDVVATTYTWSQAQDAGGDDSVSTCVGQEVDLADHLVGIVATGGDWLDTDNATGLVNGVLYTGAVAAGVYNFTYVLDNGTCTDSSMVTVTVDACLGLDANEESSLEVYPNPVSTLVTIANLNVEGNAVITLVDLQGKVVLSKTINNVNGNYELDLSAFENGVYMIEITSETATQTVRVVKH